MKTFKHIHTMLTILICLACFSFQPAFAQNYFAGTGAGTGNTGNDVTGVGYNALHSSNSGSYNSAFGYSSLYSNTTGYGNVATGVDALYSDTSGYYNTANGRDALYSNTSGYRNIAVGIHALYSNTTGSFNTAMGSDVLYYNTTGSENTANGAGALEHNTYGGYNTANGYQALLSNISGYNNTANGHNSLYSNTTGSENTANGDYALFSNTGGFYNTANGGNSLYSNTSGYYNTANGYSALYANTTGEFNTANGDFALSSNTTGYGNTANGDFALYSNTTGLNNTANGDDALYLNTTGSENTANGEHALFSNTTGYDNAAFGFEAGSTRKSIKYGTFIGAYADVAINGLTNCTAIGYGAIVDSSNKVRIGNTAVTSIGGQVNWTNFSDARIKTNIKENVPGLAFINLLRPVTYHFDISKENELFGIKESADDKNMNSNIEKISFTGFLAQDVDKAAQKINYDFSGVDKSGTLMGLRYSEFVVPLVKAVQELSAENDSLKNEINEIKAMIFSGNQSSAISQQATTISSASISQNIPNPFSNTTTINYTLPQKFASAQIIITDQNGKVLKQANINVSGKGSLNVDASTLISGAYNYSLIVDGKLIDTKKMILTK